MVAAPFLGTVQQLAQAFALAVKAHDQQAADTLTAEYARVRQRLMLQVDTVFKTIAALQLAGEDVGPALLGRSIRLYALLQQIDAELHTYAGFASQKVIQQQQAAIQMGQANAAKLLAASMAPAPGISATFNQVPTAALSDLVGVLGDGSPVTAILAEYGQQAAAGARQELIHGLATGVGPRDIARAMAKHFDQGGYRALVVARTETIRAYRESSLRTYKANVDVCEGWLWWSARDRRTCPVCWSMHGTKHSLDETFGSHVGCRCVPVPLTKTWADLGVKGVPGDRPLRVRSGADEFAALSPAEQRAILGPAKFVAYQAGQIALADLVKVIHDPTWGTTRTERALRDIINR